MAKKTNLFDGPSDGVKAGAPGDEKPPVSTPKATGTRKRRTVDTRMADLLSRQKEERDNLKSTIKSEALAKKLKKQLTPAALSNLVTALSPAPDPGPAV